MMLMNAWSVRRPLVCVVAAGMLALSAAQDISAAGPAGQSGRAEGRGGEPEERSPGRGGAPGGRAGRPWRPLERRGAHQEPAFARGYADGYRRGLEDSRDRNRYDPVAHRDYRAGDLGYQREYGSRDSYRNNYRAGFRQGYEEGYRGTPR